MWSYASNLLSVDGESSFYHFSIALQNTEEEQQEENQYSRSRSESTWVAVIVSYHNGTEMKIKNRKGN